MLSEQHGSQGLAWQLYILSSRWALLPCWLQTTDADACKCRSM